MRDPKSITEAKATFDQFADGYNGGMDNSLKRLIGGSHDHFIAIKAEWLMRQLEIQPFKSSTRQVSVLDYGCGTGILLSHLAALGLCGEMVGTDVSSPMLAEGRKRWHHRRQDVNFVLQDGAIAPFKSDRFDIVLISSVLHHVPPAERFGVYREARRLLRPSGLLVIFEHNPRNPLTRWVVARTPIDRDAILLDASELESEIPESA